jgi:rod shape-determining protein MreD
MRRPVFYFIVFWIGIVVQFGAMQHFAPYGIAPNFILVLLIFLGLMRGSFAGLIMGFLWGISWDIMSVELFGSHALLFTCLGYLAGFLSHKWNESKIISQIVITGISSVLFWVGMAVVNLVFSTAQFSFKGNYIMVLQPLYNMLIAPAVFIIGNAVVDYFTIDYDED